VEDILAVIRAALGIVGAGFLFFLAFGGRRQEASSRPTAASPPDEWRGGRLMIRPEPGVPDHARVIGSLTGDAIRILIEAVDCGVRVLDLSEVDQADAAAIQILAGLGRDRCTFVACPRWLELWLTRARLNTKGAS
jgi:hypothetical protein